MAEAWSEVVVRPSGPEPHRGIMQTPLGPLPCALGRTGVTGRKREGDGATPLGSWPMRRLLLRPGLWPALRTGLPHMPIGRSDGWCDEPGDANYNRPVVLPYPASCERLWRNDDLYDAVVVLGYNDDPPVAGRGSAIFLHLATPDYGPTAGCVALSRSDLAAVLAHCRAGTLLTITD